MDGWKPPTRGALDDTEWPESLVARAVEHVTEDDRLHGYAMLGDVARHYRFSDAMYLSIVGELPDDRASALFHLALASFATLDVSEAPCHVGVLSRICGGAVASALGAGVIAVADQARTIVEAHASLLAWLQAPAQPMPADARAPGDAPWLAELLACARHMQVEPTIVQAGMSRSAAVIALLYEAGLRTSEQMQAAIVASRLCGLTAEVLATTPKHLGEYPVKLPPFHYVEDQS